MAEAPSQQPRRSTRWRILEWLVPAPDPAAAIYGLIAIGALLAAESGRHESYLDLISSAAIAAALYWFAHSYAGVLGERLRTRRRLTPGGLARALGRDLALLGGTAIPLLALTISALCGAAQESAVTIAVWATIVGLAAFELLAGVRSGASRGELLLETSAGLAMGAAILSLKIVLH